MFEPILLIGPKNAHVFCDATLSTIHAACLVLPPVAEP
jgi:hypothetical protein